MLRVVGHTLMMMILILKIHGMCQKNDSVFTFMRKKGIIVTNVLKANQYSRKMGIKRCLCRLFEYETPRFVTVRYLPLGILKIITQICVLVFVVVYEMYYAKGYQTFANVRSSVTTKVIFS